MHRLALTGLIRQFGVAAVANEQAPVSHTNSTRSSDWRSACDLKIAKTDCVLSEGTDLLRVFSLYRG